MRVIFSHRMSKLTAIFPQSLPVQYQFSPLVHIIKMQANALYNRGQNLVIHYSFNQSHFGPLIIGSTPLGICHAFFYDNKTQALNTLKQRFANAFFKQHYDACHQQFLAMMQLKPCENTPAIKSRPLTLHLVATDFQLAVWQALLNIPAGQVSTYGQLAEVIHRAKSARAVGNAIGKNAIACIIPCHRVIQKSGALGGYRWGQARKAELLAWEACK